MDLIQIKRSEWISIDVFLSFVVHLIHKINANVRNRIIPFCLDIKIFFWKSWNEVKPMKRNCMRWKKEGKVFLTDFNFFKKFSLDLKMFVFMEMCSCSHFFQYACLNLIMLAKVNATQIKLKLLWIYRIQIQIFNQTKSMQPSNLDESQLPNSHETH